MCVAANSFCARGFLEQSALVDKDEEKQTRQTASPKESPIVGGHYWVDSRLSGKRRKTKIHYNNHLEHVPEHKGLPGSPDTKSAFMLKPRRGCGGITIAALFQFDIK